MYPFKQHPKTTTFLILVLTLVFIAMNFSNVHTGDQSFPDPEGESLWTYMNETSPYTEWAPWPGKEEMYEGKSPHGAYLKLYVNSVARKAIENGRDVMPDRTIIVKENYNKNKQLVSLTPMYKVENYNPEEGDWFWAKFGKDGEVMAEGKTESCINCHAKAEDDDYLFSMSNHAHSH